MMVEGAPSRSTHRGLDASAPDPIRLPEAPAPERSTPISVVVLLVPAAIAVVMFFIIGSPYALMFALFSPLLAVAGVLDRRIFGRRRMRIRRRAFEVEVDLARKAVIDALARRRAELAARFPSASDFVRAEHGKRMMFRTPGVVLGWGEQPSGLRFSGAQPDSDELLRKLYAAASVVSDAPVVVNAGRIIVHPGRHASNLDGVLRALFVSAHACEGVTTATLRGLGAHRVIQELKEHGFEPDGDAPAQVEISVLDEPGEGSVSARVELLEAGFARCSLDGGTPILVRMGVVGATEFGTWLGSRPAHLGQRSKRLPTTVHLHDVQSLGTPESGPLTPTLAATFAVATDAPFPIDLVTDGPHALVSGTTGSGKSELLISWACALAARYAADALQLLCLDFKGGATFDVLVSLPHCAGIVTDLDGDEALRVSASLLSEVRGREHALRAAGVRDLAASPSLFPRLVIFVDEYQALLASHPQLQAAFADVAARGRSLGMHLVLCTQRPGGVFRDALLANATLRLCLRVEEAFDSQVMLGTDAATRLPAQPRGRLLERHGGATDLVQVAISAESFIERIRRTTNAPRGTATKLWHPPLPHDLPRATLRSPAGTIPFALADLPEEQAQPPRYLRPGEAPLAIHGRAGSGRSTALRSIAEGASAVGAHVQWLEGDVEQTWDALQHQLARTRSAQRPTICLIDDLDRRLAVFEPEYRAEFMAQLQELAREHRARNCTLVASLSDSGGEAARLLRNCGSMLRLAHASRQAWTLNGGEIQDWQEHWPPGRGRLGRELVQVALPVDPSHEDVQQLDGSVELSKATVSLEGVTAVVTRDVERVSRMLASLGKHPVSITGAPLPLGGSSTEASASRAAVDKSPTRAGPILSLAMAEQVMLAEPEQWQTKFGLLADYARSGSVLVHGLAPGEYRSLFRGDPLPPPLADRRARAWLRAPGGEVSRVSVR